MKLENLFFSPQLLYIEYDQSNSLKPMKQGNLSKQINMKRNYWENRQTVLR